MKLKNLKTIETIKLLNELVEKGKFLLVYNPRCGFVLFNTTTIGRHGYYGTKVYKGITEYGGLHNMFLYPYDEKVTATPYTHFMYFEDSNISEEDQSFLDEIRNKILMVAAKKKNHREVMEINK